MTPRNLPNNWDYETFLSVRELNTDTIAFGDGIMSTIVERETVKYWNNANGQHDRAYLLIKGISSQGVWPRESVKQLCTSAVWCRVSPTSHCHSTRPAVEVPLTILHINGIYMGEMSIPRDNAFFDVHCNDGFAGFHHQLSKKLTSKRWVKGNLDEMIKYLALESFSNWTTRIYIHLKQTQIQRWNDYLPLKFSPQATKPRFTTKEKVNKQPFATTQILLFREIVNELARHCRIIVFQFCRWRC